MEGRRRNLPSAGQRLYSFWEKKHNWKELSRNTKTGFVPNPPPTHSVNFMDRREKLKGVWWRNNKTRPQTIRHSPTNIMWILNSPPIINDTSGLLTRCCYKNLSIPSRFQPVWASVHPNHISQNQVCKRQMCFLHWALELQIVLFPYWGSWTKTKNQNWNLFLSAPLFYTKNSPKIRYDIC